MIDTAGGCFELLIDQIRTPIRSTNSSRDIMTPSDLSPSGVAARQIVERLPDYARGHECPDIDSADLRVR